VSKIYSLSKMLYRLCVRRTTEREIPGLEPVIDGGLHKSRLGEGVRNDLRLARQDIRKPFLKDTRDLAVQLLSATF